MKISLNWLADYIDATELKTNTESVLEKLTLRGLEVEGVDKLSKGFDKVVIAQIKTRDKHPNSDRLSLCMVDNGKEVLQIVCGAQNMKAGDKVALSMIGANLPNGMKIEKGKIRDVESFGMLCSEVELGIAEKSEGIMILPADAPLGAPLAPYIGRDDTVFEINVTPNRGDALSHIGVAREIASILGQKLKMPAVKLQETGGDASTKIKVQIEGSADSDNLCMQYHARYIEGVKVAPSPDWLQKKLLSVGLRPINNIVDVTNFVLMEMGTPLHAFDYDKLSGAQIRVRLAAEGEKIPLLDDTTVTLTKSDLVIADAQKPVAIAGVMGGGNSEVTDATKNILLENAQFLPATVRRTAKRHMKHTDSSHRFERAIDREAVLKASERAAALIAELGGGKVYKGIVSAKSKKFAAEGSKRTIAFSHAALNIFIGTDVPSKDIKESLEKAGFGVEANGDQFVATVPTFRPDVEIKEDVFEEIIRVWGYEKVEPVVPALRFIPDLLGPVDQRARVIEKLRTAFASLGFNETLNYAFTSKAQNDFWGGEGRETSVQLANPLNEQFTTMKTSLLGGVFESYLTARNHQIPEARLFEIRPVYFADDKSETGVREEWRIAGLISGRAYANALAALDHAADFFDLKGLLEEALEDVGCRGLRYEAVPLEGFADRRFHPGQTAKILLGRGPCGFIGRIHPKIETDNKLREPVYVFEISLDRVLELSKSDKKYAAISKFPKVSRDLSLLVPEGQSADKIVSCIQKNGRPLVESVAIVDLYRGDKIGAGQVSLSVSMVMGAQERTLEDAEVESTTQKILLGLDKELSVKLRQV